MTKIADRTCVRALFGLTLCRDEAFLRNLTSFNFYMGFGTLVGQLPPVIRPTMGWLTNPFLRFYKARASRTLVPIITKQMQEFKRQEADGTLPEESEMTDFLSQSIRVAMTTKVRVFEDSGP